MVTNLSGTYRPPQPKSSPYITPQGAQQLDAELKQLWKVERPQVTAAVQQAAKNGDRSENGDYIYGKKRLREIDRRVRYLSKRLEALKVIDRSPADRNRIYFGAWVNIENLAGMRKIFALSAPMKIKYLFSSVIYAVIRVIDNKGHNKGYNKGDNEK
jgi:transcription elongation factor GreB